MSDDDEEEYVVEAIRAWRYNRKKKQKEYHIKWLNYAEEENTWEPEDNLKCPDFMKKFVSKLHGKQKKYFNHPERLNGFQRNAEFLACVGVREATDSELESDDWDSSEKKPTFYCLIMFNDHDRPEPISLNELQKFRPQEAFKFCEERIHVRKKSKSTKK